jgi:hypothetical protein
MYLMPMSFKTFNRVFIIYASKHTARGMTEALNPYVGHRFNVRKIATISALLKVISSYLLISIVHSQNK